MGDWAGGEGTGGRERKKEEGRERKKFGVGRIISCVPIESLFI